MQDSLYSQESKNCIAGLEGKREIDLRDKQIRINASSEWLRAGNALLEEYLQKRKVNAIQQEVGIISISISEILGESEPSFSALGHSAGLWISIWPGPRHYGCAARDSVKAVFLFDACFADRSGGVVNKCAG